MPSGVGRSHRVLGSVSGAAAGTAFCLRLVGRVRVAQGAAGAAQHSRVRQQIADREGEEDADRAVNGVSGLYLIRPRCRASTVAAAEPGGPGRQWSQPAIWRASRTAG